MARFFDILSPANNALYIDGIEVNLTNKIANLNKSSVSEWSNPESIGLNGRFTLVEYKSKIHIFGTNYHKTFDGTSFETASTLPTGYDPSGAVAVVYQDKIHIFGGGYHNLLTDKASSLSHYTWDPTNGWSDKSDHVKLPYSFYDGGVVVFRDQIHILGGGSGGNRKKHYYYDGKSWKTIKGGNLPQILMWPNSCKVLNHVILNYGQEKREPYICILISNTDSKGIVQNHIIEGSMNYISNKWEWIDRTIIPTTIGEIMLAVKDDFVDDEFEFITEKSLTTYDLHYLKWESDGSYTLETIFTDIPVDVDCFGSAILFNGTIYAFGSDINGTSGVDMSSNYELYTLDIIEE